MDRGIGSAKEPVKPEKTGRRDSRGRHGAGPTKAMGVTMHAHFDDGR